jgi:CspA family cold shock protein
MVKNQETEFFADIPHRAGPDIFAGWPLQCPQKPICTRFDFSPDNQASTVRACPATLSETSQTKIELPRARTLQACTDIQECSMASGTVKFYNDQKGFGFIAPDDGGTDVFVHATALERAGMRILSEGQKVTFTTAKDARNGKMAVDTISAE